MPKKYQYKETGRGPEMKYAHQSLVDAVEAVKKGESIRAAAKRYNVPRSTLGDKISGRSDVADRPGRPTAVPAEVEQKIVNVAIEASKRGMGISIKQLRIRTAALCKRMNTHAFKNAIPSQSWWDDGVKKRHPELVVRKPEKLGSSRARMLNPSVVNNYFRELGKVMAELNLKADPSCVWNCDETGKSFQHTPVKVLAERGSRNVVSRVSENRTNLTVMACVNAAGDKMPPMLIVKGKTSASLHGFNVEAAPEGTIWTTQENGWMSDEIGEKWFRDIFMRHCGDRRPQLLVLDGHSSHESLGLLQLAMEQNIHIFCLPPHTTHKLQPLDVSVFGPFNAAYNEACSNFLAENPLHLVNKWTFPSMFSAAWERGLSSKNIQNGFRACGILPFDPTVISVEDMHPSAATDVPSTPRVQVDPTAQSLPVSQPATLSLPVSQPATLSRPVSQPATLSRPVSQPATLSLPVSQPATFSRPVSQPATLSVPVSQPATLPFPVSQPATLSLPVSQPATLSVPVSQPATLSVPVSQPATLPFPVSQPATLSLPVSQPATLSLPVSQPATLSLPVSQPATLSLPASQPATAFTDGQTATILHDVFEADDALQHLLPLFDTVVEERESDFLMEQVTSSGIDNIWNTAVTDIFLPPTPVVKQETKKSAARNTKHRLLTSEAVLSEKREKLRKKEEKERKADLRKMAKMAKS